jgi:hypothetical protein
MLKPGSRRHLEQHMQLRGAEDWFMRRLVLLLFALVLMSLAVRANGGIELRGHLSANDTELQEGYFAVAQDTVLMVRPGSPLHQWLKEHQGQSVRVVVEPATTK